MNVVTKVKTNNAFEIVPLTKHIGAELRGIDLRTKPDDETIRAIYQAWLDHLVIVFPGQSLSQEDFTRVTGYFGELGELGRPAKYFPKGYSSLLPGIMLISNIRENGEPIDRPLCDFIPEYQANNLGQRAVSLPKDGGFITSSCTRSQAGPLRDCGFRERAENLNCTPGREVRLRCKTDANDPQQAVRFCENSAELGGAIACMYRESLITAVIGSSWTNVDFICPAARGDGEPGGSYGYYTAPILPNDPNRNVTCQLR